MRAVALLAVFLLGACATHGPHYYGDDGPPDHVPSGVATTPDATPRIESINPHANRPYVALGHLYTPDTSDAPFQQRGIASWYGRQFQGNRTASGETYDMFAMSAAHPTLPIPSYARVTNVRDGNSVIVRINDRGPFLRERIIDLSYAAAVRLGIAGSGSGEVVVEKITAREIAAGHAPRPAVALAAAPATRPVVATGAVPASATTSGPVVSAVASSPLLASAPVMSALSSTPTVPASGASANWSVQLGAFAVSANAEALRDRIALLLSAPEADGLPAGARAPWVQYDGRLSRVLIGSLADRATAQAWAQQLGQFLVRQTVLYAR
ncbi:MAG TPA: septal ring lytic transglycosylase RlpA family protein [Burkholderiaceae bacterium]|nr:septal ring lytic transglycosylase RlpA family protein [Burkholderiaceae bacterium]